MDVLEEDVMTQQTTALLALSPRTSGPWQDSVYRISHSIQLVEGGSSAYWLTTSTQPPAHNVSSDVLRIECPESDYLTSTVILLAALHAGDENAEGYLLETHNIDLVDLDGVPTRRLAEFWELEPRVEESIARLLAPQVRMAVTVLDEMNIFSPDVVQALRDYGFQIEVFTRDAQLFAA